MKRANPKIRSSISGFSLIEILIATVLVLFLSSASYRILTKQGTSTRESVWGQKQNSMMLTALDRFSEDVRQIDPNWLRYGIATVYPEQGYAFGDNFYVNTYIQDEGLNDGVTFLRRSTEKAEIYSLSHAVSAPAAVGVATPLYNEWVTFNEPEANIDVKDWVLFFKPGDFALGVVTDVSKTLPAKIKVREPNEGETVLMHTNMWGRSSGFVIKEGVVPGSYDWKGTNTADANDDSILMEEDQTKVQVVKPISYTIDWMTSDKKPLGGGNTYALSKKGTKQKVLVRTEYTGVGTIRDYITEVQQIGLTYDVLTSTSGGVDSLSGYIEGEIEKNVGRESSTSVKFIDLTVVPDENEGFISTSRILSLRLFLSNDIKQNQGEQPKYNEVHVAIDPSRNNNQFQEDGKSSADNSENLTDTSGLSEQQIGNPLYFKSPGSEDVTIVAPITYLNESDGTFQNGKLVIMDKNGCPITSSTCSPDPGSEIQFTTNADNSFFYPHTVVQLTDDPSMNKILVGGMAVTVDNTVKPPIIKREPAMAKIEFSATDTLEDVMEADAMSGTSGTLCSLSGCKLEYLNTGSYDDSFKDTAGGFATDSDNNLYVASLTNGGSGSTLSIYKTKFGGSSPTLGLEPFQEIVVDSSGIAQDRAVSAMAQTPITVDDKNYLPICLSRTLHSGATAIEDGRLVLYDLSGTATEPIEIGSHNFKCTSLQNADGNLLIGGKLVFQIMQHEEIASIVKGETVTKPTFYLDEIAEHIDGLGVNYYADAYKTLPSVYNDPVAEQYQQVMGWNTGLTVSPISPTEFGIVMGNRAMISEDAGVKGTVTIDQQDLTTMTVTMGGIEERVLATISTNPEFLNKSEVIVQFGEAQSDWPSVILPGVFYYNPTTPRQTLAPLPDMDTGMANDAAAFDFFIDYINMNDMKTGLTVPPVDKDGDDGGASCSNSYPQTCGGGGEDGGKGSGKGNQDDNGGALDDGGAADEEATEDGYNG